MFSKINKKLFFVFSLILFSAFSLKAQLFFPALLPDSMRQGANAIVWLDETKLVIGNDLKASYTNHSITTILNAKADRFAYYFGYYNEFYQVKEVTGFVFDAFGKKIASFKKKDLEDEPEEDGFSLVTSTRIKFKDLRQRNYPYTVEIFEENQLEGYINLPGFRPVPSAGVAVVKSNYELITPQNLSVRYLSQNGISAPDSGNTNSGNQTRFFWELNSKKPLIREYFESKANSNLPEVLVMTDRFKYGGYSGKSDSWKNFGTFFWNLNFGRDQLPEAIQKIVHNLVDSIKTDKGKAIVLYKWLQSQTRYINVALGIGGMQPFEAAQVADKKYGDCKGLNNYMNSLLKIAGVESYYCLVASGSNNRQSVVPEYPHDYFNHIITCVPNNGDTLWLECTSQTNPPGFLGSFTGDRKVLVLKESGGELVSTKRYPYSENSQLRTVIANVDSTGQLSILSKTRFTGLSQEFPMSLMHHQNEKERLDYLNRHLNLPSFLIEKASYSYANAEELGVDETIELKAVGYASLSGRRMFLSPNIFNKSPKPSLPDSISTEVIIDEGYYELDSVVINLPLDYELESLPKNSKLETRFGYYDCRFSFMPGQLKMIRKHTVFSGKYPRETYQEYQKQEETIYKADQMKVVLIKKI